MASALVSSFSMGDMGDRQQRSLLMRDGLAGGVSPESGPEPSIWNVLTQKARSILLEDETSALDKLPPTVGLPCQDRTAFQKKSPSAKQSTSAELQLSVRKPLQKSLDAIASSLSLLGDTLGTAIEEGFQLMDGKPSATKRAVVPVESKPPQRTLPNEKTSQCMTSSPHVHAEGEFQTSDMQLTASRNVAMAMATKAKRLVRELKILKAEQNFFKERCAQLEEENRQLLEGANGGDDFIRHQLESLLAEKQRLAQENANYARENQLLHEVVEYHHLTLQDVANLDDTLRGPSDNINNISVDSFDNP